MLNEGWNANLADLTLECVGRHVPNVDAQNPWVTQQRLMRHVDRCLKFLCDGRLDDNGKHWICHEFGRLYLDFGRLEEAETMYQRALRGYEKACVNGELSRTGIEKDCGDSGRL